MPGTRSATPRAWQRARPKLLKVTGFCPTFAASVLWPLFAASSPKPGLINFQRACRDQIERDQPGRAAGASFTFAIPTTRIAPEGGTFSRLATFSRPQRPDGSQLMRLEILRRAVVERQRVDRKTQDFALLHQPLGGLGRQAREMECAGCILAGVLGGSPTWCAQPESIATQQLSGSFLNRFSQVSTSSMLMR